MIKLLVKGVLFLFVLVIFHATYESFVLYISGDNSKQASKEFLLQNGVEFQAKLIYQSDKLEDDECQACVEFIEQEVSVIAVMWENKSFLKYEFYDVDGERHTFSFSQDQEEEVYEYLKVIHAANSGPFSVYIGNRKQLASQEYSTSDHLVDAFLSLAFGVVILVAAIYS
ncbi:MAG: hypothetical protein ABJF11_18020 [Reichenbachiella sp.]|uniref:hypothetical protein n=1 Tax=Reichenbachiella sp. TaxID=2184521 RepID=UPI003265E44C